MSPSPHDTLRLRPRSPSLFYRPRVCSATSRVPVGTLLPQPEHWASVWPSLRILPGGASHWLWGAGGAGGGDPMGWRVGLLGRGHEQVAEEGGVRLQVSGQNDRHGASLERPVQGHQSLRRGAGLLRLLGRAFWDFKLVTAASRPSNTPAVVTAPTFVPTPRGHSPSCFPGRVPWSPWARGAVAGNACAETARGGHVTNQCREVRARSRGSAGLCGAPSPALSPLALCDKVRTPDLAGVLAQQVCGQVHAALAGGHGRRGERGQARHTCACCLYMLVSWDLAALCSPPSACGHALCSGRGPCCPTAQPDLPPGREAARAGPRHSPDPVEEGHGVRTE